MRTAPIVSIPLASSTPLVLAEFRLDHAQISAKFRLKFDGIPLASTARHGEWNSIEFQP